MTAPLDETQKSMPKIKRSPQGEAGVDPFSQATSYTNPERKGTGQELSDPGQHYRNLVELSPDGIAIHCDGKLVYANPAAVNLMGAANASEVTGKPVLGFVHPDYHEIVKKRIQQTQKQSTVGGFIHEKFIRTDGKVIDVEVIAIPMTYDGRSATQVIFRDISERLQNEERLRASEERYRRQAEEFAALFETARDLTIQRNMITLFRNICERVRNLMGTAGCAVYIYHEEQDEIEIEVAIGMEQLVGKRIPAGEGMSGIVIRTMQPLVVEDYRTWEHRSPILKDARLGAVAMVPMHYSGELLGMMTIYEIHGDGSKEIRRYTENEVNLLAFFAGIAASALHNTRLFLETKRRLVELEVLYQTSLASTQAQGVAGIAQRIVMALEDYLDWRRGSIWILEPEGERPVLLAHRDADTAGRSAGKKTGKPDSQALDAVGGIVGWVCKNGQAVRTGNIRDVDFYIERDPRVRSELCVPLLIGGRVIGCINVESFEANAFSANDERLLTTVAGQAAISIETARLFEETHQQAARQTALNAIIRATTQTDVEMSNYLDLVLDHILEALDLPLGALWLLSVPVALRRVVTRGVSDDLGLVLVQIASQQATSMKDTVVIQDWLGRQTTLSRDIINSGIRSSITVPLLAGEHRIGGLSVASKSSREWTADEIALVEAVGREVGTSVERASLFIETRARLAELEAVNRVSTISRVAHSLDEMLPNLIDDTLAVLRAEAGSIWLFDPQSKTLQQAVERGWHEELSGVRISPGEGIVGRVFSSGDVYFSKEMQGDSQALDASRTLAPPDWGALCVPIRAEQEIIGVFSTSARSPREFMAEDAHLLVTLSEIAGNAIHRMRLFEQTEHHAAELEERVAERTVELEKTLMLAWEADRLKTEFIANMNHELRTPLTNLVLYFQMLRSQPEVKVQERLDVVERELQRLRQLIDSVLHLSRFDLGQTVLDFEPQNLNTMIRTLVEDRRALAGQRSLDLETELDDGLPDAWLDEPSLVQVISNLLTNAMNYTPAGGRIVVATFASGNGTNSRVGFSVQDNGPGIDEDDLPHLFDRFYRGKAAQASGAQGSGLGLAIVKSIVNRHGGLIEVENISGGGAKFTVWLPVEQEKKPR